MFGWFRSDPKCPISPQERNWVDKRWKWLEGQFGSDRPRKAQVILPRPEFFPDPFKGAEEDIQQMLDRVCGYMGLNPATVKLSLFRDHRAFVLSEGLHHGAAGFFQPEGNKFQISLEVSNLQDPLAAVATLAHELGHVHLIGHGRISEDAEDHEPLTDLLTVFLGLGVFTANAVIREHYWHVGEYSGWSIGRQGYLGMPMYGYAFARFARSRGEDGAEWSNELRLDVRSAFKQAMRFLEAEELNGSGLS